MQIFVSIVWPRMLNKLGFDFWAQWVQRERERETKNVNSRSIDSSCSRGGPLMGYIYIYIYIYVIGSLSFSLLLLQSMSPTTRDVSDYETCVRLREMLSSASDSSDYNNGCLSSHIQKTQEVSGNHIWANICGQIPGKSRNCMSLGHRLDTNLGQHVYQCYTQANWKNIKSGPH
jgi:hypothetical protein